MRICASAAGAASATAIFGGRSPLALKRRRRHQTAYCRPTALSKVALAACSETVTIVVQVNGKLRDRVQAPSGASSDELEELARARPNVQAHIDGHEIAKVIVVPDKLVNVVVR